MPTKLNKSKFSWALYDWANSAYATVILAGFFPLFFKEYWSNTTDVSTSTFQLGLTNAIASTVIVILAPVLGAIADAGNLKLSGAFTGSADDTMQLFYNGISWYEVSRSVN